MSVKSTKRQRGFTLIELISVIVILGILAAVITPKYLDMTASAEKGAAMGAVSEGISQFNMSYSKYLMDTGALPTNLAAVSGASYLNLTDSKMVAGDYTVTYTAANIAGGTPATGVKISAVKTTKAGAADAASYTSEKTIPVNWGS